MRLECAGLFTLVRPKGTRSVPMPLPVGTRLGPYEIVSPVGAGGMGEVYRARDARLGREVAVKVLPAGFSGDAERLRRFEQEACAAGALNHPNILVVHDIGAHDGSPYVVSELLEGGTLRERLNGTALSQRKALDYAQQIARGLAAAHERGIVHRDLKPENVFITTDERAKILDFGLAKLTQANGESVQTEIPTRRVDTGPGVVMGTVGYMAPEQVRGQNVDHRADIFSFGAVFYEMLTGRRAFRGESAVDTLSAILKEDPPDLSESNRAVSPALERLVLHCLEKNPAARFHSASDLAFALEALSGSTVSAQDATTALALPPARSKWREWLPWLVAAVAVLVAALALFVPFRRAPVEKPAAAMRFLVPPPEKAAFAGPPMISPDGRLVVATVRDDSGRQSLWVRPLDSLDAKPLAGTENGVQPFWSPDSRSVGFYAGGKLKKIDVSGGPAQTLCDARLTAGGAWSRDGVIVFGRNAAEGLYRIPITGGSPAPVTVLDKSRNETFHSWPYFLPDGRHFLYVARSAQREKSGIYVGSLDSKETRLLLNIESGAAYAPPGYLLFVRERTLMVQPFDAERLQLTGEAVPIAEQVGLNVGNARAQFSVSETGVLVYRNFVSGGNTQLVWFDRAGKQLGTVWDVASISGVRLSPDGKRVALQRFDTEKGTNDIWLVDIARGIPSRLTFDPASDVNPVWSPDGSRILFSSQREGVSNLYQKLSSGAGQDESLLKSDDTKLPNDWSSDGRYILYQALGQGDFDLWVLPLFEERQPVPYLQTDFLERGGRFSPDGRWVAYISNASGKPEVYVRNFPDQGGQWQISNGGGEGPRWRRDGRELFYIAADSKLMATEVNGSSGTFEFGIPKPLFELRVNVAVASPYDVAADGQRFLVASLIEQDGTPPATVVLNWTAALQH